MLHGIKSNACPRRQVPTEALGIPSVHDSARDFSRYDQYQGEKEIHHTEIEQCWDTLETLVIKIGQNIFHGLPRVWPQNVEKRDMVHTLFLALFKHMMDWVQRFLKKHARQQGFDYAWKALPPYLGFYTPKKAYSEVTQWQGKEIRNLGHSVLGVLAGELRQPVST